VTPGAICKLPAPSLKIVSTSLVALKEASTVDAVVLVKLEVVTAVPWTAKVFAVTVPEMGKLVKALSKASEPKRASVI